MIADRMRVYSGTVTARDGLRYAVHYLLTGEELAHYQQLGLVGEVDEVIGLAPFDDGFAAMWWTTGAGAARESKGAL